jgi:predicted RNA methylase
VPFCGTGIEARALLDVGYRVIAIDIDPRHVAMTRYRLSGDQPVQEKPVTVPQENTPTPETAPITLDDLFGF